MEHLIKERKQPESGLKNKNMKKAYIVKLSDMDNDILTKFVDQETWDWVNLRDSGRPNSKTYSWEDTLCPSSVVESIRKYRLLNDPDPDPEDGDDIKVFISSGSWENDRAIMAPPLGGTLDFEFYGNTKTLLKKIKEAKSMGYEVDLENEYSGLIY